MVADILVSRTDDLAFIGQFFNTVRTPSGDTGNGKDRCEQFHRKAKHGVDKTAVKVHIGTDRFEQLAMLLHEFDGNAFNTVVKFEFFVQAFLVGKCLGIFLQNNASWIGFCIYRMTDAIDEALAVKGFAVQDLGQILSNFIVIIPVGNMFFDIFEHLLNLRLAPPCFGPFREPREAAMAE